MIEDLIARGIISENVELSKYTSFKIGGPARFFAAPANDVTLKEVIASLREENIDFFIIGNGSNLLVSDKGYDGCAICMRNRALPYDMQETEDRMSLAVDAGYPLSKIATEISKRGYRGFEFATGIPGSVGGGVVMNAGAYGGEIKDCIKGVEVLNDRLEIEFIDVNRLELSYRHSLFSRKEYKDYIVLRAYFEFEKGDSSAINLKIEEQLRARRDKQPLNLPSAGSTFKRPEGYFAGKLIEDSGLRGYRVGGASISTKHCNFVVNDENATAADVRQLMKDVQRIVNEKFSVMLEPEVRFLGDFD